MWIDLPVYTNFVKHFLLKTQNQFQRDITAITPIYDYAVFQYAQPLKRRKKGVFLR